MYAILMVSTFAINKNPSHVSICLPYDYGSVMGYGINIYIYIYIYVWNKYIYIWNKYILYICMEYIYIWKPPRGTVPIFYLYLRLAPGTRGGHSCCVRAETPGPRGTAVNEIVDPYI